ncbi:glycosyltransferase family 4 protein [Domibacillus indicus]|uniref:glycosyltransferase family 4 protein n=1 Tax=Domibacillus indicus TaxID=1437523 RepID=UPI002040B216|nr:glycosyltransferase family 4 protein [Domibacillus indicus]MCM3788901.1 glycosyltransferase family 4 protein [Domibacillus indicus]
MKNVLFIASVYDHLAAFHKPFIKLLQDMGYSVHAAASPSMGRKEEISDLGVSCHDISFDRSPLSLDNMRALKLLKKLFKGYSFDLVHVHTPVAALLTRMALRKRKKEKVLYTAHGFHFYEGASKLNWLLYYNAEKMSVKWTDGILVMNNEDYSNALKLGYKEDKLFMVHGVGVGSKLLTDHELNVQKIKEELNIEPHQKIISFVAELNNNKNHQYLLRNWKNILKKCPNVMLLILGKGNKESELKAYVEDEKLKNIQFLGYRNDVHFILSMSEVATLLSKREGLPKSLMEAMSQGVPCVVTDIRGSRDLIKNNENGYVVPLNNDETLINAFIKILQNDQLRDKMSKKSIELVEPYLMSNVLKEYEFIYRKFLENDSVEKERRLS